MNPITGTFGNALGPQAGPESAPAGGPAGGPAPDPVTAMTSAHDQSAAKFQKIVEAHKQLEAVRTGLDSLMKLGDQVQDEDLIKAAGDLTVHGISPQDLAGLLASAPSGGGQALQGWIAQQDAVVKQHEAALAPVLATARHQLGVDAMHVLMAHHMAGAGPMAAAQGAEMATKGPPTVGPSVGAPQSNMLM